MTPEPSLLLFQQLAALVCADEAFERADAAADNFSLLCIGDEARRPCTRMVETFGTMSAPAMLASEIE